MKLCKAAAATLFFFATLTLPSMNAEAKGCIKGAVVGGVAGHMVGHGKMGALAGCVVGHHNANKAPDPSKASTDVKSNGGH